MALTLSSRVGTAQAVTSGPNPARPAGLRRHAPDRSIMARCLAYLFGAGASLALVSLAACIVIALLIVLGYVP